MPSQDDRSGKESKLRRKLEKKRRKLQKRQGKLAKKLSAVEQKLGDLLARSSKSTSVKAKPKAQAKRKTTDGAAKPKAVAARAPRKRTPAIASGSPAMGIETWNPDADATGVDR